MCFVGIGLPSTAANLARRLYDPSPVLVYESGCIGSKPNRLPLSIGDGELGETADSVVSVPEIFAYWLQAGRIDIGFLGGAQLDRFANINSTVIGDYDRPRTRLPGAGGAPEIAASAGEVMVIMRQTPRAFVERVDFRTSIGFGDGAGAPGAARPARRRTAAGRDRPRPAAARPVDVRADDDAHPSRRDGRAVPRGDGMAAARGGRCRCHRPGVGGRARRPPRAAGRTRRRGGVVTSAFTYEQLPQRVVFGAGRRRELAPRSSASASRVFLIADGAAKVTADELAEVLGERVAARWRRGRPARPRRARRAGREAAAGVGRRRARLRRRRLVDRAGQGDRAHQRPADRRRADHLRRQRADDHLRAHRRPPQADRQGPGRAAEGRHLRPRADARPAADGHRAVGVQRPRPLRRGAVRARPQPGDQRAGAGGRARDPARRCRT